MTNSIFPTEHEMLSCPAIVAWKNLNLEYIGASTKMMLKFGFKNLEEVVGSTVYDIKCPMVECADNFITQDKKVIKEKITLTVLDIHPFADDSPKILLGNRAPLLSGENQVIGTVYTGIEVNIATITSLMQMVIQKDTHFYGQFTQRSYSLNSGHEEVLTEKEKECLFYILRGFTAKHIAIQMHISNRTVETHIANIKRKLNCNFKNELIDKAIELGYMSYLPSNLLSLNISLVI